MLSKSQISFVNALHHKKYRKEQGLFIVEGTKSVNEFLRSGYITDRIFCTPSASSKLDKIPQYIKLHEVTEAELQKISLLNTPQEALALVRIAEKTRPAAESFKGRFILTLDGVQDPGNMGTIIRTADWFGFRDILCSPDTVDAYNPKVVQATMGSLSRMTIFYAELGEIFETAQMPVYGAFLDGAPLPLERWGTEGFILLGNEGNGISDASARHVTQKITIPGTGGAESLNVAISAAIICYDLSARR
jgi:RNA methyltransferase, TrmH family